MPPIQKNSAVPKNQASKVWRHFGDNRDGAFAKCLLCIVEGDTHKALLVNKYSYSYCKIVAIDRIRAEIVFCLLFLRVFEIHVATLIVSSTRSTESYQSLR